MRQAAIFLGAAIAEIAGCYAFWGWLRLGKPLWFAAAGMASLFVFAWLLTLVDVAAAGRAYAVYGGVYVAASLVWLRFVEGVPPDRWDLIGGTVCLAGASIILWGPRSA
ncbi:YnfA family protein [Falsiroseomonas sp.]|uniref:YnfA family protein n=1 Tax=Falsiroseomonas sp. TaxID=2870721 RepID=UPI002719E28C|nr:YnfA family protein [Falsiroseomonas sp.]MDO9501442.1 YnfA family protein [Falsiroseomonas sp.]